MKKMPKMAKPKAANKPVKKTVKPKMPKMAKKTKPQPAKKEAADKLEHERALRRVRDARYRAKLRDRKAAVENSLKDAARIASGKDAAKKTVKKTVKTTNTKKGKRNG